MHQCESCNTQTDTITIIDRTLCKFCWNMAAEILLAETQPTPQRVWS